MAMNSGPQIHGHGSPPDPVPDSTRRARYVRLERLAAVAAGIEEPVARPAAHLAGIGLVLPTFGLEELQRIPVVCPGERLVPGATYLDLKALSSGAFSAPVEAYTGEDAWYVAQASLEPELWSRLQRLAKSDARR